MNIYYSDFDRGYRKNADRLKPFSRDYAAMLTS